MADETMNQGDGGQSQDQSMTFDSAPVQQDTHASGMTFDPTPVQQDTPAQPQPQQAAVPNSLHIADSDSPQAAVAKGVNAIGAGAGQGVLSSLLGAAHLEDKLAGHLPTIVANALMGSQEDRDQVKELLGKRKTELEQQNVENPILNGIGFGGETLTEFLTGDGELKALPLAQQLGHASKIMETVGKSPRLVQALKYGAAMLKAGAELSPEEMELVQKYPKIAKLVGIGHEALRAATTQGAQTYERTGDAGQAAKDALETGAVVGGTGAVAGAVGGVVRKGARAAKTVEEMGKVAEGAPTDVENNTAFKGAVDQGTTWDRETAKGQLDAADSTVNGQAEGAPGQQAITDKAQRYVKEARQNLSDEYVAGRGRLHEAINGTAEDGEAVEPRETGHEGSPLQQSALDLIREGQGNEGPYDAALRKTRPGSPEANAMLEDFASPTGTAEAPEEEAAPASPGAGSLLQDFIQPNTAEGAGAAAGETGEEAEPTTVGLDKLMETRQLLSERLRNLGFTDSTDRADRKIYSRLIQGVDETIGKLADESDAARAAEAGEDVETVEGEDGEVRPNGNVRQILNTMNEKYRTGIARFGNKDVEALESGKVNGSDIAKRMMRGETSLDDLKNLRDTIGQDKFDDLTHDMSKQYVADAIDQDTGKVNYNRLLTKIKNTNADVRNMTLGADKVPVLTEALNQATGATGRLAEVNKSIAEMIGDGDLSKLMHDPERLADISNVVGKDGMKKLGRSLLDNQISKASNVFDSATGTFKKSNFNPDQVLEWWNGMKDSPEVRDTLFTPDEESKTAYNKVMKDLGEVSSVKKLVKYGVLPATFGAAGVVHGPLAALIAASVAGGAEAANFGKVRDILDDVANKPALWRFLAGTGRVADKAAPAVAPTAKGAANILHGLSGSLSGQSSNNGKPKKLTVLADDDAPSGTDAGAPPTGDGTVTDTPDDPVTTGYQAMSQLPQPVQNAVKSIPVQIVKGAPITGRGGNAVESNVDQGAGNNTIEINNNASFQQHPQATMGHELTHAWQNSLPPSIQAKIPDDPNDMSAFDISDADKLRKQGKTLVDIPREKAATIIQKYIEDPKKNANLKPWVDDMRNIPLSSTMPTAPNAKGLNMTPRAPGLPGNIDTMYKSLRSSLGDKPKVKAKK